ncbi:FtsK/SpoIIIE domain-containing protein [Vibrio mangrovi]|uniref:FtsK/SpoIIIE domain-containing protein n=1 Tax=Vibrio mangrovi TaxID=474394 RepID=A0A1Y6IZG3_9VIBR|nr:FtsK/SpoIIIE domain-containing protein [Vibrio mangrovi]MDW6002315.1 FtsK/SpoIIIE domain-containing protein [Vibrio mangrovi]SMS03026.1 FtsK/SpoIIIE family protein [Vibrio mangrovi]
MVKKTPITYTDMFTSRGRSKIMSNIYVNEGGRIIDSLRCHTDALIRFNSAQKRAETNPEAAWQMLSDLYQDLKSPESIRAYSNFWNRTEAEKEYKELLKKVYDAYVSTGVFWMSRSDKLSNQIIALPYVCNLKCSLGEHCIARLIHDPRRGSNGHAVVIEPRKGGIDVGKLGDTLSEVARICGFTHPEVISKQNRIIIQEDLQWLSLIAKTKSPKLIERFEALCVAVPIKDVNNNLCEVSIIDPNDPTKGVALISVTSTISISSVKARAQEIADYLGLKKIVVEQMGDYINIYEDRTQIEAVKHAESNFPIHKVKGLCVNLGIMDKEQDTCLAIWYEKGTEEVVKFTSTNGYLKSSVIAPFLEDIIVYMGWDEAELKQEGGSVDVIKSSNNERLSNLAVSSELSERISALPYHFALTDVAGDELIAEYNQSANFIHLQSKSKRSIQFSSVNEILVDIESYLGWPKLQATRFKGSIIIHDDTCKESSIYIPAELKLSEIISPDKEVITYGVTVECKSSTVNLRDFQNTLIVGMQGSGKSTFMMNLTYQLARNAPNRIDEFCCIDLKNNATFSPLTKLNGFTVVDNPDSVIQIIDYVASEVERRNKVAAETYSPDGVYQGGFLFLLIEEYTLINSMISNTDDLGKVRDKIEYILKIGRSARVRVIAGLQRSDEKSMRKGTKDQFANYFLFRVVDKGYADNMFDGAELLAEKGWRPITLRPGRCIVQLSSESDIFQMQTPLIYNDEFRLLMNDIALTSDAESSTIENTSGER